VSRPLTAEERELAQRWLDVGASALETVAHLTPAGPVASALGTIVKLGRALAETLSKKSVDELLRDIRMPAKVDTSFRDDIDERIRDLPEKG
jgi:hypothetical protein